jgi:hypothetical protein
MVDRSSLEDGNESLAMVHNQSCELRPSWQDRSERLWMVGLLDVTGGFGVVVVSPPP